MSVCIQTLAAFGCLGLVVLLVRHLYRAYKLTPGRLRSTQATCRHVPLSHYRVGSTYAEVRHRGIDGIQREHAYVQMLCGKCYCTYTVCSIHLPARQAEKDLRAENDELKRVLSQFMEGI